MTGGPGDGGSMLAGPATPTASYVICATPRSGTNLLCEALWLTGVAGRPEEHFLPWSASGAPAPDAAALGTILRNGMTPNGVFGVKLMMEHLGDVVAALRTISGTGEAHPLRVLTEVLPAARFIRVSRRDTVRQAVSWAKAIRTGQWTSLPESFVKQGAVRIRDLAAAADVDRAEAERTAPAAGAADVPLDYDYDQIAWCHRTIERHERDWGALFASAGITPHHIHYRDMTESHGSAVREVLAFLGLPPADPAVFRHRVMRSQSDATNEEWLRRFTIDRTRWTP